MVSFACCGIAACFVDLWADFLGHWLMRLRWWVLILCLHVSLLIWRYCYFVVVSGCLVASLLSLGF